MFGKGTKFFTPERQQTLVEDTSRVIEQASRIALSHLRKSASCPPVDVLEFLDATNSEIKSRIDNLYDILPITRHLVRSLDETEPRQVADIGHDKDRPPTPDTLIKQAYQKLRGLRSEVSSASHSAEHSRRRRSNPSKSSKKRSYGSSDSPSSPSIFSDSGTYSSTHPLTGTVTSGSLSEVEKSSSKPTDSNSTRASSSCRKCKATFSDPAEFE